MAMDTAAAAALPPDLEEATRLAEEFGIGYRLLQKWWTTPGKLRGYRRGDGRILLSRAEVMRLKAEQERIVPLDDPVDER